MGPAIALLGTRARVSLVFPSRKPANHALLLLRLAARRIDRGHGFVYRRGFFPAPAMRGGRSARRSWLFWTGFSARHRGRGGQRIVMNWMGNMFAIVRTGGKQYRVAAGDKIAVEKLAGEAGETITLDDVLLAGDEGKLADAAKVKVLAEIIAQAKSEKVIVFKKRRRHNYRRKNGHRQQLTLLRIVSVA
jgi:large subunit ribosomal protein L21